MCLTLKSANNTIEQYMRVPHPHNPNELVGVEYKKKSKLRPVLQKMVIGTTRRTAAQIRRVVVEYVADPHARAAILDFIDDEYRIHRTPTRPIELEL